jgi:hypothetical protein
VAYVISVSCTDTRLVIEMCHIYGGISGFIYGGNHRHSTLDNVVIYYIGMVHCTVVSYFVLPLQRIWPCLRFLLQYVTSQVCGGYFLFPVINRTALTMPFAFCVQ